MLLHTRKGGKAVPGFTAPGPRKYGMPLVIDTQYPFSYAKAL